MADNKVAKRYASSLFGVAQENNNLDAVSDDMQSLISACRENDDLLKTLHSPIVGASQKESVLRNVFASAQKETLSFFALLVEKNRTSYIVAIAQRFNQLCNDDKGIIEVSVQSAQKLADKDKKDLIAFLEKQTGAKDIALEESINPDLLGGMIVKYQDRLLDNSVLSQINNLKKELDIV